MGTFGVGGSSRTPRICSVLVILGCLCFLGSGSKAGADTYTVTNLNDTGAGSLRQAISDANSRSGADTIVFAPGIKGTIPLLTALPTLSDDIEIDGPGANLLTVDRAVTTALDFRFFLIDGAGSGPTVTLSGLTLSNGVGVGGGGAVKNVHGNVTLRNCALTFNQADFMGGGIFNAGTMTLVACTLQDNQVGGIAGPPPVYRGGGIYNTGTLTLTQCTLGENNVNVSELTPGQATGQGGGIYNTGDVTLSHCTVAGNYVRIYYSPTIISSVDEPGEGNAIYNTGSVTLNNTILFQSEVSETKYLGATFSNVGGTVVSHGYNLTDSDTIGLLTGPGDKVATTRVLGQLGRNGGPTPTFNPVTGGPAIDAGDPAFTDTSVKDQRGWSRVIGGRIDIGAVEFRPSFDFDGDGHNDLLFQNSATGSLVAWYMHGLALQGGMGIGSLPEPGWKVVATGDFNDDGNPDLVFQNMTTKKIVIWYMAGTTYIGGIKLPSPPSNYTVVGAGNFIGRGGPNLVLVDSVSHDIHIWMLDQGTIALDTKLQLPRQDNFPVVAVGDLNQDGYADLLLQDATTGQLVAWYFTGLSYKSGKFLQTYPDPAWKPKAIGDYNNDGSVDIVFQNATTGKAVLWFMKDLNFQGGDFITARPQMPYQIAGSH